VGGEGREGGKREEEKGSVPPLLFFTIESLPACVGEVAYELSRALAVVRHSAHLLG